MHLVLLGLRTKTGPAETWVLMSQSMHASTHERLRLQLVNPALRSAFGWISPGYLQHADNGTPCVASFHFAWVQGTHGAEPFHSHLVHSTEVLRTPFPSTPPGAGPKPRSPILHANRDKLAQGRSSVNVVVWRPDGGRCYTGTNSGQFLLWNGTNFSYESSMQVLQVHGAARSAMPACNSCFSEPPAEHCLLPHC
jgi:hypothetical protein